MIDIQYTATKNNVHIVDSYKCKKRDFGDILTGIEADSKDVTDVFKNRSMGSLKREWVAHNFCHSIGFKPERTASIDLNFPQKWYIRTMYFVAGVLAWVFVD